MGANAFNNTDTFRYRMNSDFIFSMTVHETLSTKLDVISKILYNVKLNKEAWFQLQVIGARNFLM